MHRKSLKGTMDTSGVETRSLTRSTNGSREIRSLHSRTAELNMQAAEVENERPLEPELQEPEQQPASGQQQPASSQQQPASSQQQGPEKQSASGREQPASSQQQGPEQQPASGQEQPASSQQQPASSQQQEPEQQSRQELLATMKLHHLQCVQAALQDLATPRGECGNSIIACLLM